MLDKKLKLIIEALLFVSDKPVTLGQMKAALDTSDTSLLKEAISQLKREYEQNHSFRIREVAGGYQLVTDPEYAPWLRKLFQSGRKERLSRPALETLAIIAYKQPITRAEIEVIRGVDVDGVIKTLLEKGLIRIAGRRKTVGRPILYATTRKFLEYFGLNSLDELPPLEELVKMEVEDEDRGPQEKDR